MLSDRCVQPDCDALASSETLLHQGLRDLHQVRESVL